MVQSEVLLDLCVQQKQVLAFNDVEMIYLRPIGFLYNDQPNCSSDGLLCFIR